MFQPPDSKIKDLTHTARGGDAAKTLQATSQPTKSSCLLLRETQAGGRTLARWQKGQSGNPRGRSQPRTPA
jgi:hypothetical protein